MPSVRTLGFFLGLGLRLEPRRGNGRCNSTGRFLLSLAWRLEPRRGNRKRRMGFRSRRFSICSPVSEKRIGLGIPCRRGLMILEGCPGLRMLSQVVVIQNLAPVVRRLMGEQSSRPAAYPLRPGRHDCMMSII